MRLLSANLLTQYFTLFLNSPEQLVKDWSSRTASSSFAAEIISVHISCRWSEKAKRPPHGPRVRLCSFNAELSEGLLFTSLF